MTTTFCVSGSVVLRAGSNATILTETQYSELINCAEAQICNATKYDWVTYYPTDTTKREILREAAASYAAIGVITYDPTQFTSANLQVAINTNTTKYNDAIQTLENYLKNA